MVSRKEVGTLPLRGKAARGVFTTFLLGIWLVAPVVSLARPGPQQMGRGRMENGQQPHLGIWLQRHGNMNPEQQQRALQSEPGFNRLPPETQQKLLDRLHQINRMPLNQRQRTVDRIEAMERLSPQMRQQVRASVQAFHYLPPDRQRLVRKAFRDLREYPPEQRAAMMRSPQFAAQFSPQERGMLNSLLTVEPYQPARGAAPSNELEYGR